MSDGRVIYDTFDGEPVVEDLTKAPLDSLIQLAIDGDETASQALASRGLDFEKIFEEAVAKSVGKATKTTKSPEEKDAEEVE